MTEPKHITPRLGRKSAVFLSLVLMATIAFLVGYLRNRNSDTPADPYQSSLYVFWLVGMLYGLTAGTCWLATAIQSRYLRWLAQAGLAVAFAWPLQALGSGVYLKYLSSLGGLVFFQSMLFSLLTVPRWSAGGRRDEAKLKSSSLQFGIGEIIGATTCVAVLLGIAIRFQPPDATFVSYWLMNILCWLLLPLIAATIAAALLGRPDWRRSVGWFLGATLIAATGVVGLSVAEFTLTDLKDAIPANPEMFNMLLWLVVSAYATILFTYLMVMALFAIAGRLGGNDQRSMTNVQ